MRFRLDISYALRADAIAEKRTSFCNAFDHMVLPLEPMRI
jgi:hypothetical protein